MSITLTDEILSTCHTDYFVETGTFHGATVQMAIEAGFSDIRSIEIDAELYRENTLLFADDPRVSIFLGDSIKVLPYVIEGITDPITFWLDAHGGNTDTIGEIYVPLLEEIAIISKHPVKRHILLIDDIRLAGTDTCGWGEVTLDRIQEEIRKISADYTMELYDSKMYPKDILVARVLCSSPS